MNLKLTKILILIAVMVGTYAAGWTQTAFGAPNVEVQNGQLMTDFDQDGVYDPYLIKGVGYSPTPIGRFPSDWGYPDPNDTRPDNIFDDPEILNRDFTLLKAMNANTIRIWKGNNTLVTFEDTQDPLSPWSQGPNPWTNIGRNTSFVTHQTLDLAESYGLKVILGFEMPWPGETLCPDGATTAEYIEWADYSNPDLRVKIIAKFRDFVQEFKDHPAVLFWAIGNENNNGLNKEDPQQIQNYYSLVNDMAEMIKEMVDPDDHPVAIVNGDLQFIGDSQYGTSDIELDHIDIWGINAYRGNVNDGFSFETLFDDFAILSLKALWISEYGIDAWHSNDTNDPDDGQEDQTAQAAIAGQLWDEIEAANGRTQSVGGTVMEYSDEWWKPYEQMCVEYNINGDCIRFTYTEQNTFGFGPVDISCPQDGSQIIDPSSPDSFFNEEWWGIMSIAPNTVQYGSDVLTPREIYNMFQQKFASSNQIAQPVVWTDLVGTEAPGSTLTKTVSNGWGNAGAASVQVIEADGFVEWEADVTSTYRMCGLSDSNVNNDYDTIDYAMFMHGGGGVYVYENGVQRANLGIYSPGDKFKVERTGSTVSYYVNGNLGYTSTVSSSGNLIVDAVLYTLGAKIVNANVSGMALPSNQAPAASNQDISVTQDKVIAITLVATDADGDTLTYNIVDQPVNGVLTGTAPDVVYTPNTGFSGNDSFTFKANDGQADSNAATVTVTVTEPSFTTPVIWTDLVGVNAPGSTLTKTVSNGWGNAGAASVQVIEADGFVEWEADVTSTHRMCGLSDSNVNNDYDTIDYAVFMHGGGGVYVYENGVQRANLGSYSPGDKFRVERTGSTVSYYVNGSLGYTSTVSSSGNLIVDAVLYTFGAKIVNADVSAEGVASNQAPVADGQSVTVDQDTAVNITLTATDADGDTLIYSIVDQPVNGVLTGTAPDVVYTPNTGHTGVDSFTFKAYDGQADSNAAAIVIDVVLEEETFGIYFDGSNFQPTNSVIWDGDITLDVWNGLLINEISTDPGEGSLNWQLTGVGDWIGMGLRVVSVSGYRDLSQFIGGYLHFMYRGTEGFKIGMKSGQSTEAWITSADLTQYGLVQDGNWCSVNVPLSAFSGIDFSQLSQYFMFASDSTLGYSIGDVHYLDGIWYAKALSSDLAPTADSQSLTTKQDSSLGIVLTATDPEQSVLTYTIVSQPAGGILTGTPPNLVYTPNTGFSGSDNFTFNVTDGQNISNLAVIDISVTEESQPVAMDQSISVTQDISKNIVLFAADADGDNLTYSIVDQPVNGVLTGTAPDVVYTPNTGYTGVDSFTFKANDGQADSNAATVTVTVTEPSITTPVIWTDLVGVNAPGSTLTKTVSNGWGNAGAASVQVIEADGFVEWEADVTSTYRMCGLSDSNVNNDYDTIDYAMFMHGGGGVYVYENGVQRANLGSYSPGDKFKVERTGSTVKYYVNGNLGYTSTVSSSGDLIVDAVLYTLGAKIVNADIFEAAP